MDNRKWCSWCAFFDYDEIWDGEEEAQIFICEKGHDEHIGFNTEGCEDWRADNGIYKGDQYDYNYCPNCGADMREGS